MQDRHGEAIDAEMFTLVGDTLRETNASPQLRSALYQVAATIPGVELVGTVTDQAGRQGTAVGLTSGGAGGPIQHQLIFDPDTSALLFEQTVLEGHASWTDAEPGSVITWSVYLASGVVDSTDQTP